MNDTQNKQNSSLPCKSKNSEVQDLVVVIPAGITELPERAFQYNCFIEELYLPDSLEVIRFKALEHCKSLKVLSFSHTMKTFECNAITGCDALKTIIYRGTIYEFSCLETPGQTPNLEVVYCTDGQICFGKDREHYIDTLYFPGTRQEWDLKHSPNDWRNRRCKKIVCTDDI